MSKLDMNELENVNGGAAPSFGYWKRAVISFSDPEADSVGFYISPRKHPENIRLHLFNGEEVYVYSNSSDPNWFYVKTRGVVTGYVESQNIRVL